MILASPTARKSHLPRGKARAHSRFVRVLRVALPLIMVGVVGLLATLVVEHAVRRQAAAHQDATTPIRMTNPHFFGRDNQGRAFTLGARQAARDERSLQVVLLQYPSLILDVGGPHPQTLTADSGVYHEDTRVLILRGHVRGANAAGERFATDQAVVNTKTGMVEGPKALAATTSQGSVQSNSYDIYNKGETVIFKGGVHARLKTH
ncbi:MAG: LPS export ABC transporter periplasmic protein LptC [Caulobacteraceae bacterium]